MEFDIRIDALEERERGISARRDTLAASTFAREEGDSGAINARETRIFHRYFQRLDLFSRGFPKVVLRVSFPPSSSSLLLHEIFRREDEFTE